MSSQAPVAIFTKKGELKVGERTVKLIVSIPDVVPPGVVPALVIAPGRGYHMDMPLVRGLFERVAAEGWIAARFDYSFHSQGREPSEGYVEEVRELQAVMDHVRALPQANRSRFYIAGKSLGWGIALERATADPSIRGALFLTPTIHTPKPEYKLGTVRPRLEKLRQPALIVVGERDPLCELSRLYGVLAGLAHAPEVAVVGGDHSMIGLSDAETAANVELAILHSIDWLRRQTAK